ncbi:MAG TPA: hypothetical protein VJI97_01660 [Candidatus Nanoarchaeia archaeon]|nr:hypothetical protein [Candidatus Nanoarchaeia archaeon]
MTIGPFDIIEIVTLAISLAAFLLILKAHNEKINTPESKKLWMQFLLIAFFILLNRIFTNVEVLAYKPFFNLLEHLSTLIAAFIFLLAARSALKGDSSG